MDFAERSFHSWWQRSAKDLTQFVDPARLCEVSFRLCLGEVESTSGRT